MGIGLQPEQGSLHFSPEHCRVNGGFPLFWWKTPCFKWAKSSVLVAGRCQNPREDLLKFLDPRK